MGISSFCSWMVGKKYNICGVGAGILGVPVCAVIASKCPEHSVSVVDSDENITNQWNNGPNYPICEVGYKITHQISCIFVNFSLLMSYSFKYKLMLPI